MAADRDTLRKSLAMAASDPGNVIRADGVKVGYKGDRCMGGWIADALIAGPLAPILDKADSADEAAAVLDKFEPLIPSLPAGFIGSSLPERVESIAREAIDGREGERRWAERAGITLGVSSTDDPAALADALKAAAIRTSAAEARADRLSAEVEALRADKARLDFLDRCNARLNESYGTTYGWKLVLNHNVNRLMLSDLKVDLHDSEGGNAKLPSCRLAIDEVRTALARAAVKAETEEATDV